MVFFNYATMQMAAKIVYYGPGLCGKTTNLHHIYAKTSPQSRGEMVSLETETDRTLFFDLLPIDVGVIGGFKTRLQLYTIPGQVFYNTTRKLVLKGVDGIVFVADSQVAMQDANADSFKNLRENLGEIGLELDDIPLVIQMNKRDLPNVADADTILDVLDPQRKHEHIEAIAATGVGVFETLKLISKLTLRTLRRRMTGDEPVRQPTGQTGKMMAVKAPPEPRTTVSGKTAIPAVASAATTASTKPIPALHMPPAEEEDIEPELTFSDPTLASTADVGANSISAAPIAAARKPAPAPAPAKEPDISFNETENEAATDVKRVKVRSSVDVMAELEALRKRATAGSSPKAKREQSPLEALDALRKPAPAPAPPPAAKRDVQKSVAMKVPAEVLPKARSMKVTVSFEGSEGVLQKQEQTVDLSDSTDARSLTVNLRIDS
jgi:signal recognition particle receptor subunit beta